MIKSSAPLQIKNTAKVDKAKRHAAFVRSMELERERTSDFWKLDQSTLPLAQENGLTSSRGIVSTDVAKSLISRAEILAFHNDIEPKYSNGNGGLLFAILGSAVALAAGSPAVAMGGAVLASSASSKEKDAPYSFEETMKRVDGNSAIEIHEDAKAKRDNHTQRARKAWEASKSRFVKSVVAGLGAVGLATAALVAPAALPFGIGAGVALGISSGLGTGAALLGFSSKKKSEEHDMERFEEASFQNVSSAVRDYADVILFERPDMGSFLLERLTPGPTSASKAQKLPSD